MNMLGIIKDYGWGSVLSRLARFSRYRAADGELLWPSHTLGWERFFSDIFRVRIGRIEARIGTLLGTDGGVHRSQCLKQYILGIY